MGSPAIRPDRLFADALPGDAKGRPSTQGLPCVSSMAHTSVVSGMVEFPALETVLTVALPFER